MLSGWWDNGCFSLPPSWHILPLVRVTVAACKGFGLLHLCLVRLNLPMDVVCASGYEHPFAVLPALGILPTQAGEELCVCVIFGWRLGCVRFVLPKW